ncbi:MAG: SurA N-terminal domain-containing protein [bacterium]
MLDAMRKRADSVLLKGLFVIIVLVFMFWGVGTMRNNHMEVAATVNDEVITRRQFDRAYQNVSNMYRSLGNESAPPAEFLRTQALGSLISNALMIQEARHLGLEVDEGELRDSISTMPQFQMDGRFNKDGYVQVLQANGLKPSDFEALQREQLLSTKLQDVVRSGVHISPQELQDRFRYDNERVNLRFLRLPASRFNEQVQVSDAEIQKFYDDNAERYREPERVSAALVEFKSADFAAQITPSDADVQAYYDEHIDEYKKPEEAHARHILFKLAPTASDADKAAVRKQAEEVLAKAKGGGDFAALAKQYSQDSTADAGGDLGSFGRGVMTPAFEAAAFALQPGAVSEIVETPFGLHIIKLEALTPERTQPIDEVKTTAVEAIKTQRARQAALTAVEDAHERMLDGETLEKVAADHKMSVLTPAPFGTAEAIEGLGPRPDIAKEAFATEDGEVGEIVTGPDGYVLIRVVEHQPSVVPSLDKVRGKVERDLHAQKAAELAKQKAETLRAGIKTAADLDAVATQENLHVEDAKQIGRVGTYVPSVGNAPALKDAAFVLTPEAPVAPAVYDAGGDAVIAVLAERVPADESRFESDKATLTNRLQTQAESAAVKVFLDQLKAKAKIEYGQGFTNAL